MKNEKKNCMESTANEEGMKKKNEPPTSASKPVR